MNEVAVARPRVLTVIVSYNFEPWIERCLSSIRDSDYPSDLVVIDNASTDRTVSIIAERYRWIRLVRSRKNLGFGQANNIGMRMALEENYDYVFLVNQDAWIEPNTVGTLVGLAEKYPDYGVLSPVHLDGKGEHLDGSFAKYVGGASAVSSKKSDIVEAAFARDRKCPAIYPGSGVGVEKGGRFFAVVFSLRRRCGLYSPNAILWLSGGIHSVDFGVP